jgi:hypothetical protein
MAIANVKLGTLQRVQAIANLLWQKSTPGIVPRLAMQIAHCLESDEALKGISSIEEFRVVRTSAQFQQALQRFEDTMVSAAVSLTQQRWRKV